MVQALSPQNISNMDVIIIGETKSSTVDIYFKLRAPDFKSYVELDANSSDLLSELKAIYSGQVILFVRHIIPDVFKWLEHQENYQAIYFTDDNIADLIKDKTFPFHYRRRNFLRYWKYKKYIKKCTQWVSTKVLAEQKSLPNDCVLPPLFKPKTTKTMITYCYHGSMSHVREIEFIKQIAEIIQNKYDNTLLEIYGDFSIKRQFEHIPRVRILHPIDWDSYYYHTCLTHVDIALVPLFDTEINRARSEAKSLDVLRMEAFGIFSPHCLISDSLNIFNYSKLKCNDLSSWIHALESRLIQ